MPWAVARALEPGNWKTASVTLGLPLSVLVTSEFLDPSSMRPTSRRRVTCPASPVWTMISPNCSASTSRPCVLTEYWKASSWSTGGWPICPAATCTFCSRTARAMSPAVRPRAATRSGSSQIRMLYSRSPRKLTSPTPGNRASESLTCIEA